MDAAALKALQTPLKDTYREKPEAAVVTLKAEGNIGEGVTCSVKTGKALVMHVRGCDEPSKQLLVPFHVGDDHSRTWVITRTADGLRLALAGLAVGIPAAWGATRLLRSVLFGTSPTDPLVFVSVSVLLALVALAASWLPARRAGRVDPILTLRSE